MLFIPVCGDKKANRILLRHAVLLEHWLDLLQGQVPSVVLLQDKRTETNEQVGTGWSKLGRSLNDSTVLYTSLHTST